MLTGIINAVSTNQYHYSVPVLYPWREYSVIDRRRNDGVQSSMTGIFPLL
jgi:hypothetical protein